MHKEKRELRLSFFCAAYSAIAVNCHIYNPSKPPFEKGGLLQTFCLPIYDGIATDIRVCSEDKENFRVLFFFVQLTQQ